EPAAYRMTNTDATLTLTNPDGSRETVNAGETLHTGIEAGIGAELYPSLRVDVAYSVARHTYEVWKPREGLDYSGNEMDSAPREIGSARLAWSPAALRGGKAMLEWVRIGRCWMDAANTHRYAGHDLVHRRAELPVCGRRRIFGRGANLVDTRYAALARYIEAAG